MTPDYWRRLQEIFDAAMDLPQSRREALLAEACGEDITLRRQVESLIVLGEDPSEPIASAIGLAAEGLAGFGLPTPGDRLGPYCIIREIGRGGMGSVFLATRDDQQFQMQVAIKVLNAGSRELLARFRRERQILANLDHPNIARLLDGGASPQGLPYVVMEFVDGLPVGEHCSRNALSVEERLRLFLRICSAVHFAHQNLVIHRDIKPGNILVTAEGQPKLLDFGIAKLLAGDGGVSDYETQTRGRVMTPEYASPEQVMGRKVSTATDVYSLGVLLYELLAGQRPYRVTSKDPLGLAREICEQEPVRPSAHQRLSHDLDNIVMLAMRKEPEQRYASVERLSDDIGRFLGGYPVRARHGDWSYRTRKFVRRNKAGAAVAAIFFVLLAGLFTSISIQSARTALERDRAQAAQVAAEAARRSEEDQRKLEETSRTRAEQAELAARMEADRARREAESSRQITAFLTDLFKESNPFESRRRQPTVRDILDLGAARINAELKDQPAVQASLKETIGLVYIDVAEMDRAETLLRESHEIRRRLYGANHLGLASSLESLGLLYSVKGEFTKAETSMRSSLEMRQKLGNADSADYSKALLRLAHILHRNSDLARAEPLFKKALAQTRARFGDRHLEVAQCLEGLGAFLHAKSDYAAAESHLREALAIRRALLGNDHPSVGLTLGRLGLLIRDRGQSAAAEPLLRESMQLQSKIFGEDHIQVAAQAANLAAVLFTKGDYAESEALYRQALAAFQKSVGDENPTTFNLMNNLAVLLLQKRDYDAAEPLFLRALQLNRGRLGQWHPQVADNLNNLGRLYLAKREFTKAEPYLRQTLEVRKKAHGEDHPMVAIALDGLALVRREQGDFAGAEPLHLQSLQIRRAKLRAGHPALAVPLLGIGLCRLGQGDAASAEPLFREALEMRRKALPKDHWEIAEIASALAASLTALKLYPEAEALLGESYPVLQSKQGEDSRLTREARARLAGLYAAWGKPELAARYAPAMR